MAPPWPFYGQDLTMIAVNCCGKLKPFPSPRRVVDVLLDVPAASIRCHQVESGWPKTNANDGDDTTHWSSDPATPVAGGWWAADLGYPRRVFAYRLFQSNPGEVPPNVATGVNIYGAGAPTYEGPPPSAAPWTWLPGSGAIPGDPALNGWTLFGQFSGPSSPPVDSGTRIIYGVPEYGCRYWLAYATAGDSGSWDLNTFSLFGW